MPTHSLYLTTSRIAYVGGSVSSILGLSGQPGYNLISVPSAPLLLNTLTSDSTILVVFAPNNPDESSIITDYQYSIDGGSTFVTMETITSPYIIRNLTGGATYQVQIKALNAVGEGTTSNTQIVTLPNNTSTTLTLNATNLINQYTTSIWLDTTSQSNFVLNGSNVTTWLDKTQNSYNLTPLTPYGTIEYNSVSPTYVSISAYTYFRQINFNLTYLQTWCFVVSFPTTLSSGVTRIVGMNTTNGSYGFQFVINNGSTFLINNITGASNSGISYDYTFSTNTKYLFSISLNLTTLSHYTAITNSITRLNGTTKTLTASSGSFVLPPTGATTALLIGAVSNNATYYMTEKPYYIHEMIGINNEALGINDIKTIETYLNTKWNLGYTIT